MTPPTSSSPLLARIALGDETALAELLAGEWSPLVRHLSGLLSSADLAADAAQEAFVRLWERRGSWNAGSARALLFRIGRNVAFDLRRRARVRRRVLPDLEPRRPATPAEDLERAELEERCSAALASLQERRREVFELVRLAGLSHREAAEVLGVSTQTIANNISLALRDLRHLLAGERPAHGEATDQGERTEGTWTT
jgi:RNA polymerase sigma-70 factor (ECF subfamily)